MQAKTVLRQFMTHFPLSCHMNGFGLGDSQRQEKQVHHFDYVTPLCSPGETEVSTPGSSTLTPTCSIFQKRTWHSAVWVTGEGNGVVLMPRHFPPYLRTGPPPQLSTHKQPWLLWWEDHLHCQMEGRGLGPFLPRSPSLSISVPPVATSHLLQLLKSYRSS